MFGTTQLVATQIFLEIKTHRSLGCEWSNLTPKNIFRRWVGKNHQLAVFCVPIVCVFFGGKPTKTPWKNTMDFWGFFWGMISQPWYQVFWGGMGYGCWLPKWVPSDEDPGRGSGNRPTLPETNSSHLKIGHPKRKVVFQPSIFRDYVSFREGNIEHGEKNGIGSCCDVTWCDWFGGKKNVSLKYQKRSF